MLEEKDLFCPVALKKKKVKMMPSGNPYTLLLACFENEKQQNR
jgi:hypothetical protein